MRWPVLAVLLLSTFALMSTRGFADTKPAPPDPLLLASVVSHFHLDTKQAPPATINPDGTLTYFGMDKDILLPPGVPVLLAPRVPEGGPKFEMARALVVVNRAVADEQSTLNNPDPVFKIDLPSTGLSVKRIKVVGEDVFRKQIDLITCTLHRATGSNAPKSAFSVKEGKVLLSTGGTVPKALYIFSDQEYLGCLSGDLSHFSVDVHSLPVGDYRLKMILETQEGSLVPPTESAFMIAPRFRVTSTALTEAVQVEKENLSVPVKIELAEGCGVAHFKAYLDGKLVGEASEGPFEIKAPLSDVYSGSAELTLIGTDPDGRPYPGETTELKVKNYALNISPLTVQFQEDVLRLSELDRQVEYWFTRAINEKNTVIRTQAAQRDTTRVTTGAGTGSQTTLTIINSITIVPGHQAEYLANCRKALVERAQVRFRIATAYKQMGRMQAYQAALRRIVREVGEKTPVGATAAKMLEEG